MKIKEILLQGNPTLSFEVFPPKAEDRYDTVEEAAIATDYHYASELICGGADKRELVGDSMMMGKKENRYGG